MRSYMHVYTYRNKKSWVWKSPLFSSFFTPKSKKPRKPVAVLEFCRQKRNPGDGELVTAWEMPEPFGRFRPKHILQGASRCDVFRWFSFPDEKSAKGLGPGGLDCWDPRKWNGLLLKEKFKEIRIPSQQVFISWKRHAPFQGGEFSGWRFSGEVIFRVSSRCVESLGVSIAGKSTLQGLSSHWNNDGIFSAWRMIGRKPPTT